MAAARAIDMKGAKGALKEIGIAKVSAFDQSMLAADGISSQYHQWHLRLSIERCRHTVERAYRKINLWRNCSLTYGRSDTLM